MRICRRSQLLDIYQSAVEAVAGRQCVAAHLSAHPLPGPVYMVAIGKAAASMARGAMDACADALVRGLVITRHGYLDPVVGRDPRLDCREAGHPVPDQGSIDAGGALLGFIDAVPPGAQLLFLISGGSSSLVEVLPKGVTAQDLERVNRWLLGSGLDIARMNGVRKALSCIKGGRLALRLGGRPARLLLISDVRGDDPAAIGSGLLVADPAPATLDAQRLPDWLATLLGRAPATPSARQLASLQLDTVLVARLADALEAAARRGRDLGLAVHRHTGFVDGEASVAGAELARQLLAGARGIHVWGGETTVTLPATPGRGGRCQTLALAAAQVLRGHPEVVLLAAGSDGSDGPGEDAGALVDGATVDRGAAEGLDDQASLDRADAGTYLEASGDLIQTGPTGTNVMDLIIGFAPG
ncbi:MAG: DUF4147 domain-containing protein [Gammaproteobacteria bacterium]